MKIRTAILTISTRGSLGQRPTDTSGEAIKDVLAQIDTEIIAAELVPDNKNEIVRHLIRFVEDSGADLILTTGGTGLSPTDVTPEATLEVIDRRLPGFEEAMRLAGMQKTPYAILSRAVAGTAKQTLIVNLPGNPKGVRENLEAIIHVLPHGVKVLKGSNIRDEEHKFS